jgi:hypothetical protein
MKSFLLQSPTEITPHNADYWSLPHFPSQQYKPLIEKEYCSVNKSAPLPVDFQVP